MNRTLLAALAVAALGPAGCGDKDNKIAAEGGACPTQEAVTIALTNYVQKDLWSPGERDIWKISAVDGLTFSNIEIGDPIKKVVDYSGGEKDVCPVRVTYTFQLHHADGRVETKQMGADKTHLFYLDAFHTWTFKTD